MQITQTLSQFSQFIENSVFNTYATDFWLKKINPIWSVNEAIGKIIAKKQINSDTVVITLHCNKHMNYGFSGQHHPIFIEINGRIFQRNYSLTMVDEHHIQMTVKKVANGIVSQWLYSKADIGQIIKFGQPYGDTHMDSFTSKDLVLLAAGSGITPIYSMLYHLHRSNQLAEYKIHVMYWAKKPLDFAFKSQFERWLKHYPNLKIDFFATQAEISHPRLNHSDAERISDLEQKCVFACGPSGFTSTAHQIFKNAKQIRTEAFSPPALDALSNPSTVRITLSKSGKTVLIPTGQPILKALEDVNVYPEHGCRMGVCNKCSCIKVSGTTHHLNNHSLDTEPNHAIKICINSAKTDLTLDL